MIVPMDSLSLSLYTFHHLSLLIYNNLIYLAWIKCSVQPLLELKLVQLAPGHFQNGH